MNSIFRLPFSVISMALLWGLVACAGQNHTVKKLTQDSSSVQKFESNLTFNDITLEQANQQGQPVWKVKAKQATYSKDKKVAQIQNPAGELFQDGKVAYQISAQQGEIQQDGKQLFLKGQIVATDPRNGVVMRGNELEWRPKEDLLIVRNKLTTTHKQLQVVAQEARAFSRTSRIELQGQVVATATDPHLQMQTEHLIWQIQQQKIIGDRPMQIDRYKGTVIADKAKANASEVDLKTKIATLKQNAQLSLVDPPLQIDSNSMIWNMNTEIVTADQPVRVLHRQQQVTLTANRGQMDLQKKIVSLTGNVYGVGQRRQSLKSNQLTWYIPSQLVEAEGDVVYRQVEPPASFTGQKAVGKLQEQHIVVSGGRVVTEIVP